MDLDKAFERADHTVILDSLAQLGIAGRLLAWISDFLHNRKIKVAFQGELSELQNQTCGSPQGSTISPTIFNAIIIILITLSLPTTVDILAYADDLVIISHGRNAPDKLQKSLNSVGEKANSLGLFFSSAKTKTVTFNTRAKPQNIYKIGDQTIDSVTEYKYLGVTIDRHLSLINHTKEVRRKVLARLNIIKTLSNDRLGIFTAMLLTLYNYYSWAEVFLYNSITIFA
jgi:hypothetical protein